MDKQATFKALLSGHIKSGTILKIRGIGERTVKEIVSRHEDSKTFMFSVEEEDEEYSSLAIESIESVLSEKEENASPFSDIRRGSVNNNSKEKDSINIDNTLKKDKEKESSSLQVLPAKTYNYIKEYLAEQESCKFDPEIDKSIKLLKTYATTKNKERLRMLADVIIIIGNKMEELINNEQSK